MCFHVLILIRHCVDGDVDATLIAATEAHVDSASTTSRTASSSIATTTTATGSSNAASSDAASAAPASMVASHAALVLSLCLLAFTAYAY